MYGYIHMYIHTYVTSPQVRSLTLDTLNAAALAKLKDIGNVRSNQIFEACLPEDFDKGLNTFLSNILLYYMHSLYYYCACNMLYCMVYCICAHLLLY